MTTDQRSRNAIVLYGRSYDASWWGWTYPQAHLSKINDSDSSTNWSTTIFIILKQPYWHDNICNMALFGYIGEHFCHYCVSCCNYMVLRVIHVVKTCMKQTVRVKTWYSPRWHHFGTSATWKCLKNIKGAGHTWVKILRMLFLSLIGNNDSRSNDIKQCSSR